MHTLLVALALTLAALAAVAAGVYVLVRSGMMSRIAAALLRTRIGQRLALRLVRSYARRTRTDRRADGTAKSDVELLLEQGPDETHELVQQQLAQLPPEQRRQALALMDEMLDASGGDPAQALAELPLSREQRRQLERMQRRATVAAAQPARGKRKRR